jgi:predicted nucleotidyltransferase
MDEIAQGLKLLAEYRVDCVIVGGVAGWAHGSSQATFDVDVCYSREATNLKRLIQALRSVRATLRGAPKNLPFILDEETLKRGLNFTFATEIGDLDLLGEVRGVGVYDDCLKDSMRTEIFGHPFSVLSLKKLIDAKRAAGRNKDLMALPELEALLEHERSETEPNA